MAPQPGISDAEWRVMHEIWQSEPVTSSELSSRLSEKTSWSTGTIKTLLHRLVQKGVLDFRRKGNRYLYRSNFTEAQCLEHASDQILHTVFQGSSSSDAEVPGSLGPLKRQRGCIFARHVRGNSSGTADHQLSFPRFN